MKSKLIAFWKGLDLFCKISAIAIIVVVILLLIAVFAGKGLAIFFSVVQLAGLIAAILMQVNIIKLESGKAWIKYLVLIVAVLLTVLNIMSYSWGQDKSTNSDITYQPMVSDTSEISEIPVETTVQVPYSASDCVGQDYLTIKNDFSTAGFYNIKVEEIEDLKYSETDKENIIESISIGDRTDFVKGQEFNKSNEVLIRYHVFERCTVTIHVDFVPNLILSKYDVDLLLNGIEKDTLEHGIDKEFEYSVIPGEYTITFESVESSSVKGEVSLTVDCDIEASYQISCHSDKVSVETIYVDRLTELAEGEVKLDVPASEYKYKNYTEVENALKTLGFTNIKHEVLYDIVLGWTEDGEVDSVSIAGNKDFKRGDVFVSDAEVVITYHMPEDANPANITMEKGSSNYISLDYLDVQQALKDLGFINIELEESTTEDASHNNGEVFVVNINGRSFDSGDVFSPSDRVCIKYYVVVEPQPVFYSTNDYETAKKGDTGIFSYKSTGKSYDIYWIIDFDEGYVYYFTEGNGESSCDRLKIESGTLNDKVIITYHDGGDEWSYSLHFNYINQPETLIMVDNDGFDYKYSTTSLDKALRLRNAKSIKDY